MRLQRCATGFDCDYSLYPSPEAQALFLRAYMSEAGDDAAPLSPEQLAKLSAEANLFALASHAYWGIWALVQARWVAGECLTLLRSHAGVLMAAVS